MPWAPIPIPNALNFICSRLSRNLNPSNIRHIQLDNSHLRNVAGDTMQYVNLGSTGLKVSRLCFGTMTYGSKKWREWILEEEESKPFLRQALEAGINFFDTADIYSVGVSEEILGRALKAFSPSRDKVV